ncbi:cyclase family protein [Mesorhizobium sp.]|uniref:cyclase family protein n=1 Tax=Mesorhizobium sp. TaxID=1871066 RepID=UPI000FE32EC8|nr:cyclase family protein [Mesorhizobium sp.]RWH72440.1 MAG: cyclase family protein [Mesorhizobium sp.]RWL34676.1 MAG: cyclase family protein [Mesorhizobium sp.]RWL36089.1 MAG: cyclase family protein [Mesorhizobium sp.]RWL41500.1 MAG: cyclase family protein [Mesorhizobium sp.]RWL45107.1 MAG: cyclase family protein [Mesorhizobium sp.]
MELIDLSSEIFVGMQVHPSQPAVAIDQWNDHTQKVTFGSTVHSAASLRLSMGDHTGTHVDAPLHFDPAPGAASIELLPLERFFCQGLCLDLSHIPLRHAVSPQELAEAVSRTGEPLSAGDAVLLYMATNIRLRGTPGYETDFPGLAPDAVHWLADTGVNLFGVEAMSPAPAGELNLLAHMICAERGITHIECLDNLERLVGRGHFTFIGFPLKIRGGTAGPMRAVAMFE